MKRRRDRALPVSAEGHELPAALKVFIIFSCAAPVLTALRAYAAHRMGVSSDGWSPFADPLFGDLMENRRVFVLLHTSDFFSGKTFRPVSYPPLAAVILALLHATGHPVRVFFTIATIWLLAVCWLVWKHLRRYGTGIYASTLLLSAVLISFPIIGLLQRANIELFVWIICAAGLWAYLSRLDIRAGIFWGLAGALKLYPLIFLILLLSRRRISAVVAGITAFAMATMGAIAFLGPTIGLAAKGAWKLVFGYQGIRVSEWSLHELAENHSFFGLIKVAAVVLNLAPQSFLLPYYLVGLTFFLWIFSKRLTRMPEVNQVLAVTAFMLMLPPISYFYTLVQLYVPWLILTVLFIRTERSGTTTPGLIATIFLFLPLFVPFTLLTYAKVLLFGGLVQAVALYALFAFAVQYPFEEPTGIQKLEATTGEKDYPGHRCHQSEVIGG